MKESFNNNKEGSKEKALPDADLLISLQQKKEIKNAIETHKNKGTLETTIENLKQELEDLEERKQELSNQIYSYDADDMTNLKIEYDRVDQHIAKKQKELQELSQDTDILEATIKDLDEMIEERSRLN